jgi:predicted outer membrane repeat protein
MKLTFSSGTRKAIGIVIVIILELCLERSALAAIFNVSNATDFRVALQTAATNGQDDEIILAAGTYSTGGLQFEYISNEIYSITIRGATGTTQNQVILDGGGISRVLLFDCIGYCGGITLRGMTLQNGRAPSNSTTSPAYGLGGGVWAAYSYCTGSFTCTSSLVDQMVFANNSADSGGAVFTAGQAWTSTNSTFSNNTANGRGGAIGGNYNWTVTNSTFSNNTAAMGGAVDTSTGSVISLNSVFLRNSATSGNGGAIDTGTIVIISSLFNANTSTDGNGGAINAVVGGGGNRIVNSTFYNNSAVCVTNCTNQQSSGQVKGVGADINFAGGGSIVNSIFYGYTAPAIYAASAYNFYNNLIQNSSAISGSSPIMVGNVTSGSSPFIDASNNNFNLISGSLAINSGLDVSAMSFDPGLISGNVYGVDISFAMSTDLRGNQRPSPGTKTDIGAFEFGSAPSAESCLFTWAQSRYPQYFPGTAITQASGPYHYRYYANTYSYLANNISDQQIWIISPPLGYGLASLGSNITWFDLAQAAGCN